MKSHIFTIKGCEELILSQRAGGGFLTCSHVYPSTIKTHDSLVLLRPINLEKTVWETLLQKVWQEQDYPSVFQPPELRTTRPQWPGRVSQGRCCSYSIDKKALVTLVQIVGRAPTYWLSHAWGNAHYPVFKAYKLGKSCIALYTSCYDSQVIQLITQQGTQFFTGCRQKSESWRIFVFSFFSFFCVMFFFPLSFFNTYNWYFHLSFYACRDIISQLRARS